MHEVCPVLGWYEPGVQSVDDVEPAVPTNDPAGARVQVESPFPVVEYVPTGHGPQMRELPIGIHFVSESQPPLMVVVHALIGVHTVPLPKNPTGHGPHKRTPLPKLLQVTSGEHPPLLVAHTLSDMHLPLEFSKYPDGHGPQMWLPNVLVQVWSGSQPPLLVAQKLIDVHMVPLPLKPVGQGPQMTPPVERGVQLTSGLVEQPPLLTEHEFVVWAFIGEIA